ncbi:hypothetical protein [Lysinibacillus sp. 54212]|uniref:hypothetical protein n=1 Tax=Lysinibacillus sp. 54212 TaxID=3119829 RepID=UPI002FC77E4C
MTMQDDWKKELDRMKLSQNQKERVIQHMYTSPNKRKDANWTYRLVLPAFIVLSLFAIILSLQPSSQQQASTTLATAAVQTLNRTTSTETVIWLLVVAVLLILAFVQFVLLVFRFKRWQGKPIITEIQALLRTHKEMWIIHLAAVLLLLLTFAFWFGIPLFLFGSLDAIHHLLALQISLLSSTCIVTSYLLYIHVHALKKLQRERAWKHAFKWQLLSIAIVFMIISMFVSLIYLNNIMMYIHSYFGILLFINLCFIQLWFKRNGEPVTCPHCGKPFNLRQTIKKSSLRSNKKCDYCQEVIYLDTLKSRQDDIGIYLIVPSALLMSSLDIATFIWGSFILCQALFIRFVMVPYSMYYTNEKPDKNKIPPLW